MFHTEDNCTYTIIKAPNNERTPKMKVKKKYNLIFQLNRRHCIGLTITDGVSFLFSGSVLTHRQISKTLPLCNNGLSFNVPPYVDKRLFTHIEK